MATLDRARTHKRGEGSQTLRLDHPRTKSLLATLDLDGPGVADLCGFTNRLQRDADAWMRRGGFGERGRITKSDARWLLKHELSKLEGGAK